MKEKIFIYGAGGLGREILGMIRMMNELEPAGFFDDGLPKGMEVSGLPVLGGWKDLQATEGTVSVVLALGDPVVKKSIVQKIRRSGITFPVLIHPGALLQDKETIQLGEGAVVTAGCILTTNIEIGAHVLLNLSATVGHDVHIGDFSSIMPGVNIAGNVTIGQETLVGAGVNIRNQVDIGTACRIGMGSVVLRDVPDGQTVVGVPAKPLVR